MEEVPAQHDELIGKWLIIASEMGGEMRRLRPIELTQFYEFTPDDRLVITEQHDNVRSEMQYVVNSTVIPKQLDLKPLGVASEFKGIYKIEGDELCWCSVAGAGWESAQRPTSFSTGPDMTTAITIMKRVPLES